jgi:hypothetical protein
MSKTDEDADQVKEFVKGNRRITMCEVADMSGISLGSV